MQPHDVLWHHLVFGHVSAGLIEHQHDVRVVVHLAWLTILRCSLISSSVQIVVVMDWDVHHRIIAEPNP